jgi:hypothetical protein
MVDSPACIVLHGSNRNRVGSIGRGRCRLLRRAGARIGALVGKMTLLTMSIALLFTLEWVLSCLGPVNILISSNKSLEIVGALNHMTLWGRESLSS